jgi:hypothetical protein
MRQTIDEEKVKTLTNNAKNRTIEYSCGCSYLFDHHIELKQCKSEKYLSGNNVQICLQYIPLYCCQICFASL